MWSMVSGERPVLGFFSAQPPDTQHVGEVHLLLAVANMCRLIGSGTS